MLGRPAARSSTLPPTTGSRARGLAAATLVGLALLALGVLGSAVLRDAPGTLDVTLPRWGFLVWMDEAVQQGPIEGYRSRPLDYPPGAKLLLGLAGTYGDAVGLSRPESLKLLLLTFQILATIATLAVTRNVLLAGAVWLATTVSAMGHGYLDILYTPFLMVSLLSLVRDRPVQAWVCLCAASLIKWQPLVLVPYYLVYLGRISRPSDVWQAVASPRVRNVALATGAAALLIVGVYGRTDTGNWTVPQALVKATSHNEVSGNALNAGWIGSYVYQAAKHGELGPALIRNTKWRGLIKTGAAAIVLGILWVQIRLPKTPHTALLALLTGFLAYFTFNAGVHENHLFVAMLIALVLTLDQREMDAERRTKEWLVAAGVIAFAHINPMMFYGLDGRQRPPTLVGGPNGLDVSVLLAFVSLALFFAALRCLRASGRQRALASPA